MSKKYTKGIKNALAVCKCGSLKKEHNSEGKLTDCKEYRFDGYVGEKDV